MEEAEILILSNKTTEIIMGSISQKTWWRKSETRKISSNRSLSHCFGLVLIGFHKTTSSSQLFWWYGRWNQWPRKMVLTSFNPCLWWNLQKKTRTGHILSPWFQELMPFTNTSQVKPYRLVYRPSDNWQVADTISKLLIPLKISSSTMPVETKKISLERLPRTHISYYGCDRTRKIFPRSDYLYKWLSKCQTLYRPQTRT